MDNKGYVFSFGPWNIHEGADPFGPEAQCIEQRDYEALELAVLNHLTVL